MSVGATQGTNSSGYTPQASTPGAQSTTVTQNMFLQLLVAQLKNQDPTNPSDSTAFVTQLAQFQTMQQSLNQGQDVAAIRQDLDQLVAAQGTAQTKSS